MDDHITFAVKNLSAWFYKTQVLDDISLNIEQKKVTSVIGPSGCGKSTFIRCLNRLHEMVDGGNLAGEIYLQRQNIYDDNIDPVLLRRKVGMVFQKPNPFPNMSIKKNVLSGLMLTHRLQKNEVEQIVEQSLMQAALWDEVKDRLNKPGASLSGGQQQRLCIARTLAVNPEVILMDEPCSALDPIATAKIEDLLQVLKQKYTIVMVTHNMQQAARISDSTAFFLMGKLIEFSNTDIMFTAPKNKKTEEYITGRFG